MLFTVQLINNKLTKWELVTMREKKQSKSSTTSMLLNPLMISTSPQSGSLQLAIKLSTGVDLWCSCSSAGQDTRSCTRTCTICYFQWRLTHPGSIFMQNQHNRKPLTGLCQHRAAILHGTSLALKCVFKTNVCLWFVSRPKIPFLSLPRCPVELSRLKVVLECHRFHLNNEANGTKLQKRFLTQFSWSGHRVGHCCSCYRGRGRILPLQYGLC